MFSNKLENEKENCALNFDRQRMIDFMKKCEEQNLAPDVAPLTKKNSEESTKWRNEGNKIYKNSSDSKLASALYNKSIAFAPKGSTELSLAYANKSAVLIRLKKYQECLQAIESCLSLNNYPENLKLKILLRKIECLNKLDENIEAQKAYNETEKFIKEKIPAEVQLEKLNQLNKSFKKESVNSKSVVSIFDDVIRELINSEPNKEVPALADSVALKFSEKFGRHLVASRYIKSGEIIAREKPYNLTLNLKRAYSHLCWKCAEETWHCTPCDYCVNVIFCSEKCRDEAWKMYHEVECEVLGDLLNVEENKDFGCYLVSGFQTTIKALREFGNVENLKKETSKIDNCEDVRVKGFSKDGIFRSDSYRSYYTLCNTTEISKNEENVEKYRKLGSFASYILATKTTFFGKEFKRNWKDLYNDGNVVFMSQLTAKNSSIFSNNSYGISDENGENKCGCLFPAFSFFNHSCNPNIDLIIQNCEHYALVLRPIREGEQIYISYLDGQNLTRDIRCFQLWEKYEFVCDCIACKDDWPVPDKYPLLKNNVEVTNEMFRISSSLREMNLYSSSSMKHQEASAKLRNAMFHLRAGFDAVEFIYSSISTPCVEGAGLSSLIKNFLEDLSVE